MGETFHERSVKSSRKRRVCYWCGDYINIGNPYESYRWRSYGDSGSCEMHPECRKACSKVAHAEGGWFTFGIGDFNRGCGCERGHCECDLIATSVAE